MKKSINSLLVVDSPDQFIRVLQSWRLWVVGAVIGGLLGWGVYALFPPPYRAQASVVIDYNIEDLWISRLNVQFAFFYLRETRKLEELAFSDETLAMVVEQLDGVTVQELRAGKLMLGYPYDGVWHFWVDDADSDRAEQIAKVWVEAFLKRARELVTVSAEMDALREELNAYVAQSTIVDTGHPEVVRLIDEISTLAEQIHGISSYVDFSTSQIESLPITRSVGQYVYILVGSVLGAGLLAFLALFINKSKQEG